MTQPSLNTTFDTSLIDLSPDSTQKAPGSDSFSTSSTIPDAPPSAAEPSEINSSSDSNPTTAEQDTTSPTISQPKMPVQYMPTSQAYDAWASVYDTDGNILQAIDDMQLETLLPAFLSSISASSSSTAPNGTKRIYIIDLGCGTGRNTLKLLQHAWPAGVEVHVTGIDASAKMLELAANKLSSAASASASASNVTYDLRQHDFLPHMTADDEQYTLSSGDDDLQASALQPIPFEGLEVADAVLSTLVLEHFPLPAYFSIVRSLLRPNGVALVTNMHPDMGSKSQAGFVATDAEGRSRKVRGRSWIHGVKETVLEAGRWGMDIEGGVREREVSEGM
ncbi:hypothetical protein LTS18_010886, partial [Coniosporium uncinatum]